MNRCGGMRACAFGAAWLGIVALGACGSDTADLADPLPDERPQAAEWRQVELVTRIEVPSAVGVTQAWIPLPRSVETDHQRADAPSWEGNATKTEIYVDPVSGAEIFYAEWPETETAPLLVVTSRVETLDRAVDLSGPSSGVEPLGAEERSLYLAPSPLVPTDGIVRDTALEIVGDAADDVEKARALYEWIVEHAYRDPETVGCGTGDIAAMLESGDLGGKCVDINALFVGMARSLGIPARHDYGVRVTVSETYDSLGKEGDVTKGQHCRAEFWADGYGWVPVDPADVRKLVLEEDGGLSLGDPLVQQARVDLFGSAEMNWVVYNHAENVALPHADFDPLPFLMYPQVVTDGALCDCYAAEIYYAIESTPL